MTWKTTFRTLKEPSPIQMISQLIAQNVVRGAETKNLNPASLDLSLSEEIFRLDALFQPRPTETVREILNELKPSLHNFDYPLERNVTYLVRLKETFVFPEFLYAYCNPKSTTGRNGIQVRVVADRVSRYDLPTKWLQWRSMALDHAKVISDKVGARRYARADALL